MARASALGPAGYCVIPALLCPSFSHFVFPSWAFGFIHSVYLSGMFGPFGHELTGPVSCALRKSTRASTFRISGTVLAPITGTMAMSSPCVALSGARKENSRRLGCLDRFSDGWGRASGRRTARSAARRRSRTAPSTRASACRWRRKEEEEREGGGS